MGVSIVSRIKALGYAAGVSVAVFLYLGLPILRSLYGPEAVLVAYAGIAVVAGGIAYPVFKHLSTRDRDSRLRQGDPPGIEVEWLSEHHDPENGDGSTVLVTEELEQLREDK